MIENISNVAPGEVEETLFSTVGDLHKLYVEISKSELNNN